MSIRRDTLIQILVKIKDQIELTPTNLNPLPISPDRQLALTIYWLATGCSCAALSDVFGVSVSSSNMFLHKTCRVIVRDVRDLVMIKRHIIRNESKYCETKSQQNENFKLALDGSLTALKDYV